MVVVRKCGGIKKARAKNGVTGVWRGMSLGKHGASEK